MIGAWLGASLGMESIPEEWLNKLTQRPRIEAAIKQWFEKLIEKA
jgi:ADP-ribosylglycohydrolase